MASLAEQLAARRSGLSKVEKQEALPLEPLRFDRATEKWEQDASTTDAGEATQRSWPASLSCLSFNIMKEKEHLAVRMAALLALIEQADPDFICLQENTLEHNELLCQSEVVRAQYWCSGFKGQGPGFKVSLFSKYPFAPKDGLILYDLEGRPCITGYVAFPGPGETEGLLGVSCVHLTSGNNAGVRARQLEKLYGHTRRCATALVCGDFNACKPELDSEAVQQCGFRDVWPQLHQTEPGFTRAGHRLDRAALRSTHYTEENFEIIGQEPVTEGVTISDHSGFVVTLRSICGDAAAGS